MELQTRDQFYSIFIIIYNYNYLIIKKLRNFLYGGIKQSSNKLLQTDVIALLTWLRWVTENLDVEGKYVKNSLQPLIYPLCHWQVGKLTGILCLYQKKKVGLGSGIDLDNHTQSIISGLAKSKLFFFGGGRL